MKKQILLAAASALAMTALPASAAVRYDFEAFSTPGTGVFGEVFSGSFSYVSSAFITGPVTVAPASLASCTIVGTVFGAITCNDQILDGSSSGSHVIELNGQSPSLGLTGFSYEFANGALSAPGVYNSINANPLFSGRVTVTNLNPGAVPEPASWAMMVAGFGLAGATLRRRMTKVSYA